LLAPRIHIFVLRAHPVRGESHNQRNTTGEVATVFKFLLRKDVVYYGRNFVVKYVGDRLV